MSRASFARTIAILAIWTAVGPLPDRAEAIEPANPHASEQARVVLNYLAGLPSRDAQRVLSGQYVCAAVVAPEQADQVVGDTETCYQRDIVGLHASTGKWVALVGGDYGRLGRTLWRLDLARTNGPLLTHWQRGGLVTITWHARNPWTDGDARDKRIPGSFDELLTEGNPVHVAWMQELGRIASALDELQQAGVVVLWRPLHESNEPSAFWWCAGRADSPTPEQLRQLWRQMFRYFTEQRHLNNLLWVYAATPKEKIGALPELQTYPGSDVVDVVGFDVYADILELGSYEALLALDKPVGLTEFGPSGVVAEEHSYNYLRLIQQIRDRYPRFCFVQCWSSSGRPGTKAWELVAHRNAGLFLRDPWIVTASGDGRQPWRDVAAAMAAAQPTTPTPILTHHRRRAKHLLRGSANDQKKQ